VRAGLAARSVLDDPPSSSPPCPLPRQRLEEDGVITDCEIQTMADEAPLDINLHDAEIPCNIIMRVRPVAAGAHAVGGGDVGGRWRVLGGGP
jgi:hypothetical protein